jgi:hypothetical protein
MKTIFEYVDFVNKQFTFHVEKAEEFQGTKRGWAHKTTAQRFQGLREAIEALKKVKFLEPPEGLNPLALSPEDIKDIPPELRSQLVNLPDSDKLESDVIDIINGAGGTLLLDHILLALYRRTGEIHQRTLLVSKLYRMNKKGLVFSSPAKKGAYTTIRPPEEEDGGIDEQTSQLDLRVEQS